jgi:pantoate--beta-alanine ligase
MDLDLKHSAALVPTMGALHAGHASLIEIAKKYSDEVVVSIFVNPLQFENPNDFSNYPKSVDADIELATASGATKIWVPTFDEIYPSNPTIISSGEIGNLFEGVHRFGHFDGMLTVVKRLFNLVQPKYAIFGEKDFQQLFLIKEMVKELEIPIQIIAAPIVREVDGLALSSRNVRLNEADRKAALIISKALASEDLPAMHKVLAQEPGFKLDYLAEIDEQTFGPVTSNTKHRRVIIAGWVNGVRLLDNRAMGSGA